jgi:hypothetical protein
MPPCHSLKAVCDLAEPERSLCLYDLTQFTQAAIRFFSEAGYCRREKCDLQWSKA